MHAFRCASCHRTRELLTVSITTVALLSTVVFP